MKRNTIDEYLYSKLGDILNEERRHRGYSLRYVAELTGISRTTIDKYEMGEARIDKVRWQKLCKALQIPEKIKLKIAFGEREYK